MPLFGPPNIAKLKKKRDVDGLLQALAHKDAATRRKAAKALGELGDAKAVEPLIAALEGEAQEVSEEAANALQSIRDSSALDPLIAALRNRGDISRSVRVAVLKALAEFADPRLAPEFADYIHLGDLQVREIARGALNKIGHAATGPLIATLKEDESFGRRCGAARALVLLGTQQGVGALVDALHDENHLVRAEAASALGHLGDARAVKPLIPAVGDEDLEVRVRAADALVSLMTREPAEVVAVLRPAFETILGIFNQEIPELRLEPSFPAATSRMKLLNRVAVLLGEVGDERAVEALAGAFELAPGYWPEVTNMEDILEEATLALARIGQPSVGRLVALLGKFERDTDIDRFKKSAVIEALQRIGGPDAERALSEYRARQE